MKKSLFAFLIAVAAVIGVSVPASAQLRFGIKAGVTVNSLHFSSETFDSDNRAGFTGGVMLEFTAPVSGLGVDLSAMYVRRNSSWLEDQELTKDDRDYIEIPLNFKWRMNIPVINNLVRPYISTGPSFAFLTSRRSVDDAFHNRKFDTSWNFGFGVELVNHLQVGASYGIGLTKALEAVGATGTSDVNGRNRYWTITAAYMF